MSTKDFCNTGSAPFVYIHIPFCLSKCAYCAFYSIPAKRDSDGLFDRYTNAILTHIESAPRVKVGGVYFGGGTPAVLGTKRLCKILSRLFEHFEIDEGAEITLEINPNSLSGTDLSALRARGFNRLSAGLQSCTEKGLKFLGRTHKAEDFILLTKNAKEAGFDNISGDMIFSIPTLSFEENLQTADFLIESDIPHISCYELSFEPGTALTKRLERKEFSEYDEDEAQKLWFALCDKFESSGFSHYEISNFSKPGYESRNNLNYWNRGEYFAFGAGAHGFIDGKRFFANPNIEEYINSVSKENYFSPFGNNITKISQSDAYEEYVFLGLRRSCGIEITDKVKEKLIQKQRFFDRCLKEGLIKYEDNRLIPTDAGFRLSDSIISELF